MVPKRVLASEMQSVISRYVRTDWMTPICSANGNLQINMAQISRKQCRNLVGHLSIKHIICKSQNSGVVKDDHSFVCPSIQGGRFFTCGVTSFPQTLTLEAWGGSIASYNNNHPAIEYDMNMITDYFSGACMKRCPMLTQCFITTFTFFLVGHFLISPNGL